MKINAYLKFLIVWYNIGLFNLNDFKWSNLILQFVNCNNYYFKFAFLKYNIITMNTGIVKFYDATKRFGFIKEDGTDDEHFVHSTGLIDEIQENDKVEFELKEGNKGLNAVNVKVI